MSRTIKDRPYDIRYNKAIKNIDNVSMDDSSVEKPIRICLSLVFYADEVHKREKTEAFLTDLGYTIHKREVFGYCDDTREPFMLSRFGIYKDLIPLFNDINITQRTIYNEPKKTSSIVAQTSFRTKKWNNIRQKFDNFNPRFSFTQKKYYSHTKDQLIDDDKDINIKNRENLFIVVTAVLDTCIDQYVYISRLNIYSDREKVGKDMPCKCYYETYSKDRYVKTKNYSTIQDKNDLQDFRKEYRYGLKDTSV